MDPPRKDSGNSSDKLANKNQQNTMWFHMPHSSVYVCTYAPLPPGGPPRAMRDAFAIPSRSMRAACQQHSSQQVPNAFDTHWRSLREARTCALARTRGTVEVIAGW